MAYQALARKWRPRNFTEVVGQEHVVKALTHALEFDRLHHAYLFTGTRGVGKTTLARILAKAMNCEDRTGFDPCGVCQICREVDEGRFVDLIEVDAASRTKVEDTRDLLENVQYAPNEGRYKVYLIDEVHMLSGHSFNALLKTLEEPPPHVKFLLATTDPQKIPVTVLSRCLQFNLKKLSPEQIRRQMEAILGKEGIPFEQNAVRSLSRAADGSMRDGLSLLDQAIVHGGGSLEDGPVSAMLGSVSRSPVFALLDALVAEDALALLQTINDLASHSPNFADVLQQMLIVLHHVALAQWVPDAVRHDDDAEKLLQLAQEVSAEAIQLYYQIGLLGQKDLPLAPEPRVGFEMVMLRMLAFKPAETNGSTQALPKPRTAQESIKSPHPQPVHAPVANAASEQTQASHLAALKESLAVKPTTRPAPQAVAPRPVAVAPPQPAPAARIVLEPPQEEAPPWQDLPPPWEMQPATSPEPDWEPNPQPQIAPAISNKAPPIALESDEAWFGLIQKMGLAGLTLQLASHCLLEKQEEGAVYLTLDPLASASRTAQLESNLQQGLEKALGHAIKLHIKEEKPAKETLAMRQSRLKAERQRAAELEIEQNPTVVAIKQRLDARIVPGSIAPLD